MTTIQHAFDGFTVIMQIVEAAPRLSPEPGRRGSGVASPGADKLRLQTEDAELPLLLTSAATNSTVQQHRTLCDLALELSCVKK